LQRNMNVAQAASPRGCCIYEGKYDSRDVVLVQTGVGKKRAERAAQLVLERYPVTALVSFGFGGALSDETEVGDIVLCPALYEETGSGAPCRSDAGLISSAEQASSGKAKFVSGNGLTATRVVSDSKAKRVLGKAFSAKVVDMESYWIGSMASARKVPFLAVRAISDTIDDRLPPFGRFMDSNGTVQPKQAALYFFSHPYQLVSLGHFYRSSGKARHSLTRFILSLIPRIATGPK